MMKFRSKFVFTWAVTLTALLVLARAPVLAQDTTGSMDRSSSGYSGAPGTVNPVSPSAIDDVTLKRTARAYVKVHQISENERTAINGASDDASRKNIAQRAESRKMAAVQAEGLQPQQYNQVLALVQGDKSLAQKFLSYVDRSS
jgi:hypothetical protein